MTHRLRIIHNELTHSFSLRNLGLMKGKSHEDMEYIEITAPMREDGKAVGMYLKQAHPFCMST